MEGLIFQGAYVWREICISKLIEVACSGKEIYHFALFYLVFEGKFQVQAPREAYIRRGDLMKGFFALQVLGGLYLKGLIFGILQYIM